MQDFNITWIDITVVVIYLIASRAIPLWLSRSKKSDTGGFFLGGRDFVWPMIGFSLFATNMSGSSFVGMAGAGYSSGIAVYSYEWIAAVALVVFIFMLLPFYLRSGVFTMPEFLERRFDSRSRYIFAGMLIFLSIFLDCAGALYAGGLVIQTIFPGIDLWMGVLVLTILAGIMSYFGGLGAVVISDTIQACVLLLGAALVLAAGFYAIPSWDAMVQAAPENGMSLIRPIGDPSLPWPGLFGVLIIGIYFWANNQLIVQRTLGAKTLDHGRWGSIFAGFLKLTSLFLMILPGLMALTLYPDLKTPDLAFPTIAFDLLPIVLRGIVLAALIAAITSTVDSILNSVSTMVTMDFVKPLRPHTSDAALVRIGQMTTVAVMVIVVFWAPQIIHFQSLWSYFQSLLAYVTPPVVAIFFVGILWRGATPAGAFAAFVGGLGIGILGFFTIQVGGLVDFHFLYSASVLLFIGLALIIGVSLVTQHKPGEEVDELIWTTRILKDESKDLAAKPAWQNYRYQSMVLMVVTAIIVIWFW
ncbi:sodium:solute symporter [Pistricoccus aurantiacus]|uniref:sodium:solute symporter n=1 Tax=Pistricoccus aurantiacus TaxID=1883414 RepID=UPI00362ED816